MGLEHHLARVRQAEQALGARREHAGQCWRGLQADWRTAWTPGRILVAGLAAGFLFGRSHPLQLASSSGNLLRLLTQVSRLAVNVGKAVAPTNASTDAPPAD